MVCVHFLLNVSVDENCLLSHHGMEWDSYAIFYIVIMIPIFVFFFYLCVCLLNNIFWIIVLFKENVF